MDKFLYVPPEIWSIIIGYLKETCPKCGENICKECIENSIINHVHKMCKTCNKLICYEEKTTSCTSCGSELHKNCLVSGSVKKSLSTYFIISVCQPCFTARQQNLINWDCIP